MNIKFLSVIGIFLCVSVGSGASLANAKIGNPHEPEQNFNKIKRKFSNQILQDETKTLIPDNVDEEDLEEGSGDDLDLDDEDYDDLDEYDYDDDDYYDDDDDDDLDEEGSGDDDLILPVEKDENSVKLMPDDKDNNDFVFAEDNNNNGGNKNGNKIDDKDLLYEYYNDLIYDDDDDDDDYYPNEDDLKAIEKDLDNEIILDRDVKVDSMIPTDQTGAAGYAFRPAYVFLMLASALVSFAFFTLIFILCRRSMFQPQQKVFTMSGGYGLVPTKSSPIVKNPNKTPKPTKDMLNLNYVPPPMSTSTVEMGHTDTQKPLLT